VDKGTVYICSVCRRSEDSEDKFFYSCNCEDSIHIKVYRPFIRVVTMLLDCGYAVSSATSTWNMQSNNGLISGSVRAVITFEEDYTEDLELLPEGCYRLEEVSKSFELIPEEEGVIGRKVYPDIIQCDSSCSEPEKIKTIEEEIVKSLLAWADEDLYAVYAMKVLSGGV